METKIIQLMSPPAGVCGVTFDDCGSRREVPLLALGLTELGEVVFLYLIDSQRIGRACEVIDRRGR